jgi:hypothetical protein
VIIREPNSTPTVWVELFLYLVVHAVRRKKNSLTRNVAILRKAYLPSTKRCNKQDFPVPVSPITINLNRTSACSDMIRRQKMQRHNAMTSDLCPSDLKNGAAKYGFQPIISNNFLITVTHNWRWRGQRIQAKAAGRACLHCFCPFPSLRCIVSQSFGFRPPEGGNIMRNVADSRL